MSRNTALDAIIRYEQAARLMASLTNGIGEALDRCDISIQSNTPDARGMYSDHLLDGGRAKTHLWQAYRETTDADSPYPPERRLVDYEQKEYLEEAGCPHCMRAWELVQKRKDARQAFGSAKRGIRNIGRAAIANAERSAS